MPTENRMDALRLLRGKYKDGHREMDCVFIDLDFYRPWSVHGRGGPDEEAKVPSDVTRKERIRKKDIAGTAR